MMKLRNLILTVATVFFVGTSVAPAAAATNQYGSQYSWNGGQAYAYKPTTTTAGNSYNYGNYNYGNYNYSNYNYSNNYSNYYRSYTPSYSYTPVQQTQPKVTTPTTKPVTTTPTTTTKPSTTVTVTAKEQQMVNLVNQERTSRGLSALQMDTQLTKVARMKSQDMIDNNYFGHQSPKYGSPFDLMKSQGVTYRYAGENLAGADTVQRAHTNLMNSEGHRNNILNPNFTKIGVGIIEGGPYGLMVSQEFTG
jgi:uncharacterized YkwD family protein